MNYGQVKQNIVSLGFSDFDELDELENVVPDAINRAITEISLKFAPIHSYIDITQPTGDEWDSNAYYEYIMPDDFMKFAQTPVKRQLGEGIYQRFNDYEIEQGNTIVMKGSHEGVFRIFYVADHEAFDIDTPDGAEIPLPLHVHYLVPLLASHYVWLDDDQTKAEYYYQKFATESQLLQAEVEKPRGRIATEWGSF